MKTKLLLTLALLTCILSCAPATGPASLVVGAEPAGTPLSVPPIVPTELPTVTPTMAPAGLPSDTPSPEPSSTPADTATPAPTSTSTSTATPTPGPTRTPKPGQVTWRGDLHMHTVCSDGAATYEEMVQKALELGLDFIAITDHRDWGGFSPKLAAQNERCVDKTIALCRAETRLLCIPGMEMGYDALHFLALGIPGRTDSLYVPSLAGQVAEIHRLGGLAAAAHPYVPTGNPGFIYTDDQLLHTGFDFMECAKGTEEQNQRQLQLAEEYKIPCIYTSDAHNTRDLGGLYTVCDVPINSLADLQAALIANQCGRN